MRIIYFKKIIKKKGYGKKGEQKQRNRVGRERKM